MDLWVLETVELLPVAECNAVVRGMAVTFFNGMITIKVDRNCYDQVFKVVPVRFLLAKIVIVP